MKNKISKILVIGDVMLDKYIIGEHTRQSPEADCAVLNYNRTEIRLGGAANVAYNLKQLNQDISLVSVIGNDLYGEQMTRLCQISNIPFYSVEDTSRPTTLKTRYVDEKFNQFLRVDNESKAYIDKEITELLIQKITAIVENGLDIIILQDYNKGILSKSLIVDIQKICMEKSIKLCVDPKKNNFQLLSKCDLFKPNLKELEHQYGKPIAATADSIYEALSTLHVKEAHQIYVTLAEQGIYYQKGNDFGIIEGISIPSADVSGAGDTVISALSTLMSYGMESSKMAYIANKCGAFVCKKQGVSYMNTIDFQTFILEGW